MENLTEKGVQILENSVKIGKEASDWVIRGEFVLEERIGAGRETVSENIIEEGEQTAE